MSHVFIADSQTTERFALRLLLMGLNMVVVGESADWSSILIQAPIARTDLLLVEWGLLPNKPCAAIEELREACPYALVTILINHPNARKQAAISAGGATFLCKDESPDHFVELLRAFAELLPPD